MDSPSSNKDKTCESAPQQYNRTLWQGRSQENNSPTVPNNDQGLPSAVDDLTKAGRVNTGEKRAAERSLSPTSDPKKLKASDEYQKLETMQEDVDPPFPYAEKASKERSGRGWPNTFVHRQGMARPRRKREHAVFDIKDAVRRKLVYTAEDIVDEELEAVGSEGTGGNITDTQAVLAERERHQRFVDVVLRRGRKILDGKAAG